MDIEEDLAEVELDIFSPFLVFKHTVTCVFFFHFKSEWTTIMETTAGIKGLKIFNLCIT